ncbi:hypothetical protein, partial [Secundilactobacillus odoratitofui]|uniref:hypothetical protein n=1 Tax=Secundilactobacillus odoratitofui TaxID=480930 RepID=UPI000AECF38F
FDIPVTDTEVTPGQSVTATPDKGNQSTNLTVPTKPTITDTGISGNVDGYTVTGKTTPNTTVTLTDQNGDPINDANGD